MLSFFLALIFLTSDGMSQQLTWQTPINKDGSPLKPGVLKGYRIGYSILDENSPCEFPKDKPIKYWVDIGMDIINIDGNKNQVNFDHDPNFQPGLRYIFTVVAYSKESDSNKWGVNQSDISNGACTVVKGPPRVDQLLIEDKYYGTKNNYDRYKLNQDARNRYGSEFDSENEIIALGTATIIKSDNYPPDDGLIQESNTNYEGTGAGYADLSRKHISERDSFKPRTRKTEYMKIIKNKTPTKLKNQERNVTDFASSNEDKESMPSGTETSTKNLQATQSLNWILIVTLVFILALIGNRKFRLKHSLRKL